jgi:two-component system sensor histidine kinase/response regulator
MTSHILIVDDDASLLEALPEMLRLRMHAPEIDTSDSAADALERIAETDYDAAVVDIKMPGMDGLELLAEIKKLRSDIPILLITGHGDHDLAVQALRGGAHDYVTKPIDREYLVSSLSQAIQCNALAREVATRKLELEQHARELEECVAERTTELTSLLQRERTATAELQAARQALEEANEEREEFVSMVAHELGGPLTTVRGYAEMLGRPTTTVEASERARTLIVSETRRMVRLVEDLADSVRLAKRNFNLNIVPFDIVELVREQISAASNGGDRHSISLEAPAELHGAWDRDRLAQVLSNLLRNAQTYTPDSEIEVRVWQEGDHARIQVRDHGAGIPPQSQEMVFLPHKRLVEGEANASSTGVGLGLHISRAIVEAHTGRIWVENGKGESGAIFNISIPCDTPRS